MARIIKWIDKIRDIVCSEAFIVIMWSAICGALAIGFAVVGAKRGLDVPMSDIPNEIVESKIND